MLQQSLPFTVLKRFMISAIAGRTHKPVATVLTVYGIETLSSFSTTVEIISDVATVLTVYGIETVLFMVPFV